MKIYMKSPLLLAITLSLGISFSSNSQSTDEITWQKDIKVALNEAITKGQLLFVECFSPTCSHCKAIEPFFKNSEVAKMYNTNFVNYKLDITNKDQLTFLTERDIRLPSWPRFLFFDGNGNLIHQSTVEPSIESINGIALRAMDPKHQAADFAKRFSEGDRAIEFLIEYASFNRVIQDATVSIPIENAIFKSFGKEDLGSTKSWEITKACITDIDNGFAKYWFNHVKEAREIEKTKGTPGAENGVFQGLIQGSLYGSRGKNYSFNKLQEVRELIIQIGSAQYADNLLWEFEIKALVKDGNFPDALAIGNKMTSKFQGNSSAQIYITGFFNDFFSDKSYIESAKGWLENALPGLSKSKVKAEYYYEMARLHENSGDRTEALLNAINAKEFAKASGSDSAKFDELISQFRK